MMRPRFDLALRSRASLLLALAVAAVLGPTTGSAAANHVQCGDIITQDTTLDSDLIDCPGDGIVLGADGITLDLAGHTIDGADATQDHDGIFGYPRSGVTITNGSVYEFRTGITLVGGSANAVRGVTAGCGRTQCDAVETWGMSVGGTAVTGCTLVNNHDPYGYSRGIQTDNARLEGNRFEHNNHAVEAGSRTVIRGNFVTDSGNVTVYEGSGSLVEGNTVHGGGIAAYNGYANTIRTNRIRGAYVGIGVSGQDADGNIVEANDVSDSQYGVSLTEARETRVTDNVVRRSGTGITVAYGSNRNLLARNHVFRSDTVGILLTSNIYRITFDNQLIQNVIRQSGIDGVAIDPETTGTLLEQNVSLRNGDDGIDVESPDTTITGNRGDRNRDLGIEAVDGVTDGGGNRAKHNGNPVQCVGVRCK